MAVTAADAQLAAIGMIETKFVRTRRLQSERTRLVKKVPFGQLWFM